MSDELPVYADGFDEAIIGLTEDNIVAYDKQKMLDTLQKDMTQDEAEEYFEFNVSGSYVGKKTPIYITLHSKEDIDFIADNLRG